MPLTRIAIPALARTAIQAYLWQWSAGRSTAVSTSRARLLLPHRLYRYLGEHPGGRARLEKVKPAGWRCFARTGDGSLIAVDAFETRGKFAFRLHLGRNTDRWAALIRSVRRKDRWADDRYSMYTLIAPAIYSSALWFAGTRGNNQLFALNWNAEGLVSSRWISGPEWETAVSGATSHAVDLWRKARVAGKTSPAPI
jgi:hypothetical protein